MNRPALVMGLAIFGSLTVAHGVAWAAGPTAQDVANMLNNVVADLSRLFSRDAGQGTFIRILTFLMGGIFFASGLMALANARSAPGGSGGAGLYRILAGILLMSFFTILDMGTNTLFSRNTSEILASAGGGGSPSQIAAAATRTGIFLIQVVGFVAVIRSLTLVYGLSRGGEGRTTGSVITLFISGLACINIVSVLGFIANTLGGPAPEYLRSFLGKAGL